MENTTVINLNCDADGNIIGVEVELPILTRKTDNGYHVQCPLIRTIGFSKISFDDALLDHDNDVDVFFETHLKRKTLKSALISLGWEEDNHNFNLTLKDFLASNAGVNKRVQYAIA